MRKKILTILATALLVIAAAVVTGGFMAANRGPGIISADDNGKGGTYLTQ
jgi:hypothetical protein